MHQAPAAFEKRFRFEEWNQAGGILQRGIDWSGGLELLRFVQRLGFDQGQLVALVTRFGVAREVLVHFLNQFRSIHAIERDDPLILRFPGINRTGELVNRPFIQGSRFRAFGKLAVGGGHDEQHLGKDRRRELLAGSPVGVEHRLVFPLVVKDSEHAEFRHLAPFAQFGQGKRFLQFAQSLGVQAQIQHQQTGAHRGFSADGWLRGLFAQRIKPLNCFAFSSGIGRQPRRGCANK